MSGQARNWCVARGQILGAGFTDIWRCPGGYNFILKAIHFTNWTSTAIAARFELWPGGASVGLSLLRTTVEPDTDYTWEGWTVVNNQDAFTVWTDGAPLVYWVAGALLTTDLTAPPTASLLPRLQPGP